MASSAQIEKLCGDNYSSWSVHMKSLLITLDYWSVIDGTCPITATPEEKAAWKVIDSKALATITLCIKPSELIHVKSCKNAKEAWNKLSSTYVGKTPARKVNLFKRLVRFKIQDSIGYQQQINEFSSMVESLREIDVSLPEDFVSLLLLCSLPDEYESFIVAMESRDILPSWDQLKVKVLEEHQRRGEKMVNGDEHVFAANSRRANKKKGKHEKESGEQHRHKNIRCYSCGKRGHIKANCNSKAMIMTARESSSLNSNEWIVDSGASSHMSGNKCVFSSLRELRQKVMLASGDCVFAEGIGNVNLKSEFTDITLCNVLFVPKLNANFLSVHKIIEHGHNVRFTKENVCAKNKNNHMIFEAQPKGGIFTTTFYVKEELMMVNEKADNALWHRRLV